MMRPPMHRAALGLAALLAATLPGAASANPAQRAPRGFASGFYVRGGILHLSPIEDSGPVTLADVDGLATLAIESGPMPGSRAEIESITTPALVVGYVLPWGNGRLSVETILARPLTITLRAGGTLASASLAPYALDDIPTGVPPLGPRLGKTKALPPVVTMVYRFLPRARVQPYLGAGLGYLYTYDSEITNPMLREVHEPRIDIDNALGVAVQTGIEIGLTGRFFANLDVKYIAGLDVSATVADVHVRTPALPLFESVRVGNAGVDMAVNPLVLHATVGARF